jgi:putative transposase
MKMHREMQGTPKTAMIHCDSDNKWWVIITCRTEQSFSMIRLDKIVGIDLGCKNLISTSDGYTIQPPKFLKRIDEGIGELQIRIDTYHKPTGSKKNGTYHESRTCRRLKKTIRRLYGKRARMMRNFLHTRSRKIVDHYDIVVVENLRVKEMKENGKKSHTPASKTINRIMSQNAVSMFINMLSYKSKQYLEVNPAYTSRTCAKCGQVREDLTLADRTYKCCTCDNEMDRDINAAVNIRNLGLLNMLKLADDRSDIRTVAYNIPHCNITYPCKAFV